MFTCVNIVYVGHHVLFFFFFKQKTAYEMRISDWSSDVCSSDLFERHRPRLQGDHGDFRRRRRGRRRVAGAGGQDEGQGEGESERSGKKRAHGWLRQEVSGGEAS